MGLPYVSIRVLIPQLFQLTGSYSLNLLFGYLKNFLILVLISDHDHDHDDHDRPSPSLVAVPVFFLAESIRMQVPVMSYCSFVEKRSSGSSSPSSVTEGVICVVCMNRIEARQKVSVPCNCCHVFHRECLDAWVDQGQPTCPLCRSKLLPTSQNHDQDHEFGSELDHDPWRRERMIYLFGDDYLFREP